MFIGERKMKKTIKMISRSQKDTMTIARNLASFAKTGDVYTLSGQLGVGKTAFAQGIGKGLGVKERITSPTFTIVKEYYGTMPFYHMDVYRLEFSEEDLGFEEYFYGEGITVIEWAEFIKEDLPEDYLNISITHIGDTKREIIFEAIGKRYVERLEQLEQSEVGRFIQ